MIQLNPSIPVITPKGNGLALFVNWLSEEHHLIWIVAQDDTGECWSFENPQIRFTKNITFQRPDVSDIKLAQHPLTKFAGTWKEDNDKDKEGTEEITTEIYNTAVTLVNLIRDAPYPNYAASDFMPYARSKFKVVEDDISFRRLDYLLEDEIVNKYKRKK